MNGEDFSEVLNGLDPSTDYVITMRGILGTGDEKIEGAVTQVYATTGTLCKAIFN